MEVVKGHAPGMRVRESGARDIRGRTRTAPLSDDPSRCKRAEGTAGTNRRPHGNGRYDVVSYRPIAMLTAAYARDSVP